HARSSDQRRARENLLLHNHRASGPVSPASAKGVCPMHAAYAHARMVLSVFRTLRSGASLSRPRDLGSTKGAPAKGRRYRADFELSTSLDERAHAERRIAPRPSHASRSLTPSATPRRRGVVTVHARSFGH